MLYIKLVGMQRETGFAPGSGIPHVRKNYVPTRGQSYKTHIQGICKIHGAFAGDFKHTFRGAYELDKLTAKDCKDIMRDLIALRSLHAGKVSVIIGKGERVLYNDCLPLVNTDCTQRKIKNVILSLIHTNKILNHENYTI